MNERIFTPSEANALLPRLREELRVLQELTDEYEERMDVLRAMKAGKAVSPGSSGADPYFEEEAGLEFKRMEIETAVGNFARLGVQLKRIRPGLIDFPAVLGDRDVLICWMEGEERATHYHGLHDGFAGRRPLPEMY